MMKIGIITYHWAANFGAVLQTYALQKYLSSKGHDVDIINYIPKTLDYRPSYLIHNPRSIKSIGLVLRTYLKNKTLDSFRKKYLSLSQIFRSYDSLKKINFEYDLIISGSDQVLNPTFAEFGENKPTPSYFLEFVDSNIKKIGYAVSFGCSIYPSSIENMAKTWISNFNAIGVRESSGVSILKQLSYNKSCCVVPDPTILYGNHLFDDLKCEHPKQEHYKCIYFLRKKYSGEAENSIIIDDNKTSMPLEEWVSTIKYSDKLVTNSYHGMIVAILNHVPFAVYLENESYKGMNDRFLTLLQRLGLENRIIESIEQETMIFQKNIDWEKVDIEIDNYRQIGVTYLNCFE